MRELIKKAGSLVLGAGALGLAMVHAAATHGCARRNPPAQAPAETATAFPVPSGVDPERCKVPTYMYATKAPVWLPPECYGKPASQAEPAQQAPGAPNPAQQAP